MDCWFCSIQDENPKKALKYNMYGEVDSKKTDALTKVAYNVRKISIPRCSSCKSKHFIAKIGAAAFFAFTFLFLLCLILYAAGVLKNFTAGLCIGLTAGLAIAGLVCRNAVLKGIRSVWSARSNYPEIKELRKINYKFGTVPKDSAIEPKTPVAEQANNAPRPPVNPSANSSANPSTNPSVTPSTNPPVSDDSERAEDSLTKSDTSSIQ